MSKQTYNSRNTTTKQATLSNRVDEAEKNLGSLRDKAQDIEDSLDSKISQKENRSIEVLAVITAFLAFVSVEFQIFKVLTDKNSIIGFTFILLGSMLCFIFGINIIIGSGKNNIWYTKIISFVVPAVLIIFGVLFFTKGSVSLVGNSYAKSEDFEIYKSKTENLEKSFQCLSIKGYFSAKCLEKDK